MANPAAPQDSAGTKTGFGIYLDGANDVPAWPRIEDAAVVADETTVSGSMRVIPMGGTGKAGIKDDAAFTPGTSGVVMAGFEADESGTDSVDEGDAGAGRMTLDRKQIVTPQPHTAGGLSIFRSIDIDESEEQVKGSAGQLYTIHAMNMTAAVLYLKFYDGTAAGITVGADTPVMTFPVPTLATTNGAGFVLSSDHGWAFATGITVACTTGLADADTGAPAANACVINLGYK